MKLDRWFRLLTHVALGLSCTCLVYAEVPFLPGLQVCLLPLLVLLVVAYRLDGSWVLPAWGANLLGALIAAAAGIWLALQLNDEESWTIQVPLLGALLPYLGPVLMALLVVKLFRPSGPGDFWLVQGMGLLQVGLGCVLATGAVFGLLLIAYLACGLSCLSLHYQCAANGSPRTARDERGRAGKQDSGSPARTAPRAPLFPVVRWTATVAGLALGLFLLTPRSGDAVWDPVSRFRGTRNSPGQTRTGLGTSINLNASGPIEVDEEVALLVQATDEHGAPKLDLPADTRWRGLVFDSYEGGQWLVKFQVPFLPRHQAELPDFGPGQFYLTFNVRPRKVGSLPLAEPIRLGRRQAGRRRLLPVVQLSPIGRRQPPLFGVVSGTPVPALLTSRDEFRYRQVVPAGNNRDRCPVERLDALYVELLVQQPTRGLTDWTAGLLRRLAAEPRYQLADLSFDPEEPGRDFLLEPEQWERAARALTDYLANSGEFTYTLNRPRDDLAIDPVMDFLVNVRAGHCDRFATALALMLRSVGVPTRVVTGYRGAEGQGDGTYAIRHSYAHSWVEVLVPRDPVRAGNFDWLTLDPTPSDEAPSSASRFSLSRWWNGSRRNGEAFWHDLIVEYNADQQAELWEHLQASLRPSILAAGLSACAAALVAWLLLRMRRTRRAAPGRASLPAAAFHARLLALLGRHLNLTPEPGQTPREFAAAVRIPLLTAGLPADLAILPIRVADLFYRVRFGGQPLTGDEGRDLDARIDDLAVALASPQASPLPSSAVSTHAATSAEPIKTIHSEQEN
jgi:hypothetical protein